MHEDREEDHAALFVTHTEAAEKLLSSETLKVLLP